MTTRMRKKLDSGTLVLYSNPHMQKKNTLLTIAVAAILIALVVAYYPVYEASAQEDHKQMVIKQIVRYLKAKNVNLQEDKMKGMANTVYEESQLHELDYRLVLAVMKVESNFRQNAVSPAGARGLLQIRPSLAKYISKDAGITYSGAKCLYEPDKNIRLGVYHLSCLIDDFKNVSHALHAYNAGSKRVKGKLARNVEPTNRFVHLVLTEYQKNVSSLPDAQKIYVLQEDE
jgi:soluble lytic murein transglycosylase